MTKKLNCILLIDDNPDDNFYHERVIKKSALANLVITKTTANEALNFLKSKEDNITPHPDLIFLDINMPGMNGWEFLEEYKALDEHLKSKAIVVMLTTSENPDDSRRAAISTVVSGFKTKPLTKEILEEIITNNF